jgi:putative flippase GtrA
MNSATAKILIDRARLFVQDRALRLKAISFASIGVINTIVDFSLFSFAHLYLGWPIIPANVTSWLVAVSGSYVMNTLITFAAESRRKLRPRTYALFLAAQASGLVANTATVFIASYFIPVLLAKALAIGVSFLVDFSLSNFVVFRPPRRPDSEPGKTTAAETERLR